MREYCRTGVMAFIPMLEHGLMRVDAVSHFSYKYI